MLHGRTNRSHYFPGESPAQKRWCGAAGIDKLITLSDHRGGGDTKKIAEVIAEGIRMEGLEAEVLNISEIKKESDLAGYDACFVT